MTPLNLVSAVVLGWRRGTHAAYRLKRSCFYMLPGFLAMRYLVWTGNHTRWSQCEKWRTPHTFFLISQGLMFLARLCILSIAFILIELVYQLLQGQPCPLVAVGRL